jgi:hypothetical protein
MGSRIIAYAYGDDLQKATGGLSGLCERVGLEWQAVGAKGDPLAQTEAARVTVEAASKFDENMHYDNVREKA